MPCGDNSAGDEWYAAKEKDEKNRRDDLARMLCFMCGEMIYGAGGKEAEKVFNTNPKLREWWEKHCAADFGRLVGEMGSYIATETQVCLAAEEHLPTKADVVNHFIAEAEKVHAVSRFHKEWFFGHCYDSAIAGREVFHGQG